PSTALRLCYLHRQDHAIADRAALVPAEELDVRHEPEPDRDNAFLCWPGAPLVEYVPEPLADEEADLPSGAKNTITRLGDIDRIELAIAEFAKAGDREDARFRAFGLQPFPALAASVEAAPPLRHNALGPDLAHGFEQLFADTHDMINIDDALA